MYLIKDNSIVSMYLYVFLDFFTTEEVKFEVRSRNELDRLTKRFLHNCKRQNQ